MKTLSSLVLVLASSGCGPGTLHITAWGEDFIERGIPAELFDDGFDVTYTKFELTFTAVTLRSTRTGRTLAQTDATSLDLVTPGPQTVTHFDAPGATFDDVSYVIAGPLRVEGSLGTSSSTRRRFAWSFPVETAYTRCVQPDFGPAVVLAPGEEETVELTVHGDHLWYDDLVSPRAALRGTAVFESDADGDEVVTEAELRAVELTSLPRGQYGAGPVGNVFTLWDFLSTQVRTVGHFRGEGDCLARPR